MWSKTRRPGADADDLASSGWSRWSVGIVVALVLVAYGVLCVSAGRAHVPGYFLRSSRSVTGDAARGFGIAFIGLGVFLHFRFIWEGHPRLWRFAGLGQVLSLLTTICAALYALAMLVQF